MRALLEKELRALRPYFWLVVALTLLDLGSELFSAFPDAQPFEPAKWVASEYQGPIFSILLIALMCSAGLLVNEAEHGTLAFLDGLPVSRSRLFLAKAVAGFSVVLLLIGSGMTVDAGFGWLSHTSVSGPFPWRFLLVETALLVVAGFYIFSAALVLSFLRRWLLLAVGIILWGMLWLRAHQLPYVSLFDPIDLVRPGLDGLEPRVSWRHVLAHVAAGAALLGVAWAGFCRLGGRHTISSRDWRRIFVWAGWSAVPVVWIGVMVTFSRTQEETPQDIRRNHPGGEREFGRRLTSHYEFIYREDQRPQAIALSQAADEIHRQVADIFRAPRRSDRIVVDLASRVSLHAAGQAHWKKIALPLALNPTLDQQRQVLGHETAHVFIDLVSDERARQNFHRTRWFHEGLATYVELRHFAPAGERDRHERAAAIAQAWDRVSFSRLCDTREWARQRAGELVYPLGQIWCAALLQAYGNEAPGRVTRALNSPGVFAAATSEASWRAALQACGYDLEKVNAGFDAALDAAVTTHRAWIDTVPRIRATLTVNATELLLRPEWTGEAPGRLIARIQPTEPEVDSSAELTLRPDAGGVIRIPRSQCPGPSVWYEIGWVISEARFPVFEAWKEEAVK